MEGAEAGRQGAMPPRLDVMSHLCMSEYRRGKGREGGTLACAPASDTFHCASSSCRRRVSSAPAECRGVAAEAGSLAGP